MNLKVSVVIGPDESSLYTLYRASTKQIKKEITNSITEAVLALPEAQLIAGTHFVITGVKFSRLNSMLITIKHIIFNYAIDGRAMIMLVMVSGKQWKKGV
jgi:hypothetical protein